MRPSSFNKLRMRSLGLPKKTHLMLSLSKHDRAIDLRNPMCSENTHARI